MLRLVLSLGMLVIDFVLGGCVMDCELVGDLLALLCVVLVFVVMLVW